MIRMPGIVVIVNDEKGKTLLETMMNSIKHEDWYLMDSYIDRTVAVGRVHLGILNPEPEPVFNEDGSLWIFMDGEVYDYEEEKNILKLKGHEFKVDNDPEFCLHFFEELAESFVKNLNGSFVIIIYDRKNQRLIITNDRYGLRPFYYAQNGQKYLFASEIKAILQDKTYEKEINHSAVAEFFAFGRILEYKTFFKGINVLPPASIMILSNGECKLKQYWDFRFKENSQAHAERYYIHKLIRSFSKAVQVRTKSKHNFGVFLSGGLDSRCVAAEIVRSRPSVYTFTYAIDKRDEAKIAEKVAKKLRTKHVFLRFYGDDLADFVQRGVYLTDGMCSCEHFWWNNNILRHVKEKNVDIIFHGLGVGWLATPYLSFASTVHRKLLRAEDKFLASLMYMKLNTLVTDKMMPNFFSSSYYEKIKDLPLKSIIRALRSVSATHPVNKHDCFFLRIAGRYQMGPVLLRSQLEDRIPGFDNGFIETILEIPPELRYEHKIYYKFIGALTRDLAKIPYQKTSVPPIAPLTVHKIGFLLKGIYNEIVRKLRIITRGKVSLPTKIGYPDLDEIIRKNKKMRRFLIDTLLDKKSLSRPYFNKKYITKMIDDHMSSRKDYGSQLCALLTFELWHRLFFD